MSYGNNDPSGTGPGSEPSMEEILASIRRILKDEAGKTPAAEEAEPAPREEEEDILVLDSSMIARPVDLSTATSPPPAPLPAHESPATPLQSTAMPLHFTSEPTLTNPVYTPPAAEPDVLLPPDADIPPAITIKPASMSPPPVSPVFGNRSFSDYPAPRPAEAEAEPEPQATPRSIFYQPAAVTAPEPEPVFEAAPEPVHETVHEAAPEPEPAPAPEPEPEHMPEPTPEPVYTAPVYAAYQPVIAEPPPTIPPSEPQMPEHQDNLQPPASIVSEQVSAAAANSIGAMIRSMTAEKSITVSRTGVTIEDMVREEIRPLLKAWLDTNLAGMVERVVRSEIEKIMERSTG